MKKFLYSAVALLFLSVTSCSDDPDDKVPAATAAQVLSTVKAGTWKITTFSEDGQDETPHFTGYDFDFLDGNIVTATNGVNSYNGTFSVALEDNDSDDDHPSGELKFNIAFASPEDFAELTEDWDMLQRTNTKIRLRHVSGGDGGIDILTFEKN